MTQFTPVVVSTPEQQEALIAPPVAPPEKRLLGFPGGWTRLDEAGSIRCKYCEAPIIFADVTEYETRLSSDRTRMEFVSITDGPKRKAPLDPDMFPHQCRRRWKEVEADPQEVAGS